MDAFRTKGHVKVVASRFMQGVAPAASGSAASERSAAPSSRSAAGGSASSSRRTSAAHDSDEYGDARDDSDSAAAFAAFRSDAATAAAAAAEAGSSADLRHRTPSKVTGTQANSRPSTAGKPRATAASSAAAPSSARRAAALSHATPDATSAVAARRAAAAATASHTPVAASSVLAAGGTFRRNPFLTATPAAAAATPTGGTFRRNPFLPSPAANADKPLSRAQKAVDEARASSAALRAQLGTPTARAAPAAAATTPVDQWKAWPADALHNGLVSEHKEAEDDSVLAASARFDQPALSAPTPTRLNPYAPDPAAAAPAGPFTERVRTVADDVTLTEHEYPLHRASFDPERLRQAEERVREAERREEEEQAQRLTDERDAEARALLLASAKPAFTTPSYLRKPAPAPGALDHTQPDPTFDQVYPMQRLGARVVDKVAQPLEQKMNREKQEEIFRQYQTILLQWCFVNAKQQSAFESHQVKALSEIHLVVLELSRLRQELSANLLQSHRKAHLYKLDRILAEQTRVYSLLLPQLQTFADQYDALSRGVHAALHRVPLTGGVTVSSESASRALTASSAQLGQVQRMLAPHADTFHRLESASAGLVSTLCEEVSELQTLYELVSRAFTLESAERGLRQEDMTRGKIEEMRAQIILTPEQLQAKETFKY